MGELKPCPFCEAKESETLRPVVRHGWVFCTCGAMAPVEVWNRRAPAVPAGCLCGYTENATGKPALCPVHGRKGAVPAAEGEQECTHHWTVTSPCPYCQLNTIASLQRQLAEAQKDYRHEKACHVAMASKVTSLTAERDGLREAVENEIASHDELAPLNPLLYTYHRDRAGVLRAALASAPAPAPKLIDFPNGVADEVEREYPDAPSWDGQERRKAGWAEVMRQRAAFVEGSAFGVTDWDGKLDTARNEADERYPLPEPPRGK